MLKKMVVVLVACAVLGLSISSVQALKPREHPWEGKEIFENACLMCHGVKGEGNGPAAWYLGRYSSPRPRNFTDESFKFRSTLSGELPTDQDLFRTITQGIPGYMPSFSGLTETQRWQVIAYIKSFRPDFKEEKPLQLKMGFPPYPSTGSSIDRGRKMYGKFGCQNCHGLNGTGTPTSKAGELKDERGLDIAPADLTNRTSFKGGSRPIDLYRSIMTGLDGTPMPSYGDQLEGQEKKAWDLVYYILSLSSEQR